MAELERAARHAESDKRIIRASLYLGAFAILERSVIDAVIFFYHADDLSSEAGKKYIEEVTIFSDDVFESSCRWLEKHRVIKHERFDLLIQCKHRRDEIARAFSQLTLQDLFSGSGAGKQPVSELHKSEFEKMIDLMHRVEAWRTAVEYGMTYTGEEDDLEVIQPLSIVGLMKVASLAFPQTAEPTP